MAEVISLVLDPMVQNLKHSAPSIFKAEDWLTDSIVELLTDVRRLLVRAKTADLPPHFLDEVKSLLNLIKDDVDRYTVRLALRSSKPVIRRAFDKLNFRKRAWRRNAREMMIYALCTIIVRADMYLGGAPMPRIEDLEPVPRRGKAYPIFKREDDVFALKDAADEVINLLRSDSEALEIISVVGRPGLGKTTLAKRVLYDRQIGEEFPVRVFVHVSEDYDVREIFIQILCSFTRDSTPEHLMMLTEEKLTPHVRKQLEKTKFLIIMDDVREREDWDKLKCVLSNNKKGSRVLITTRRKYVAAYANPFIKPYCLRSLSSDDSLELLRMKVFGENDSHQELSESEHNIATKCNGLPLAILLMAGSLLDITDNISEWKRVDSLDSNFVGDEDLYKTLINWVYNHLVDHLKPCFLYLSIFPMGLEIPVSELSLLWIAEGFIPDGGDTALEDQAESFLEELVDRNLVTVVERKLNGRTKTCRLNGTIREFCKEKGLEENLFQEIKGIEPLNQPIPRNQRRICIYLFHYLSTITSQAPGSAVRSFLAPTKKETTLSPEHIFFICKSFGLLKVLDVRTFILTSFPLEICELILLKYLAVFGGFRVIPSKMSSLKCMQTLIVGTTLPTLEIRADIWRMMQLRHLLTNASASLPSPGLKGAKHENLQTLSIISPESCRKSVLDMTPSLRKLGISGKLAQFFEGNDNFSCLCRLEKLEKLKLHNTDSTRGFHSWLVAYFPPQLKKLTLVNTLLPWEQVSRLGSLPYLETLKLKDNSCVGDSWFIRERGFLRLKLLFIGRTNLLVKKKKKNKSAEMGSISRGITFPGVSFPSSLYRPRKNPNKPGALCRA